MLTWLKAGIPVQVFEKQSYEKYQDRAGLWGMALHWATHNIDECLPADLAANLKDAQTDPYADIPQEASKTIPMYNGKTGDLPAAKCGTHLFLKRNRSDTCSGGSFYQASHLRSQIHPVATLGPHPGQKTYYFLTMGDVKNPNDPASWVFQVSLSYWPDDAEEQPKTQEERMALFKKLGSNYCEPFKSVAEWVKPDTHLPIDHFGSWTKIQRWNNFGGRVLIAGDAAHPMVPYRAQGLNNALEDAGSCVRTLINVINEGQDVVDAVASYDKDVYERGKSEICLSNTQMYACHHWDVLMESKLVRDGFAKC
ncbi:FAD binding domain-containing protein [Colletotrichum chrysophilum]|uniref:FAD binding domain-containing protein n=1 Tax=Colletotrichum chrysophilum TaxID=1836956 RepID=A0AAD9A6Q4_9PEZI|nr:FAD binding domain-containing protein [Colletotrichum chrysophilum]